MKTTLALLAAANLLAAVPAAAQTMPLIIPVGSADRVAASPLASADETRIALAAERACVRPFLRDLKAQAVYEACVAEVRTQLEARLSQGRAGATVALSR